MVQLILDTNLLVAAYRSGGPIPLVDSNDQIAVAAITLAEFSEGILAAKSDKSAQDRQEFLERFLQVALVLPDTTSTASCHAELLHYSRVSGYPRGAHDLIIAAHAKETSRTIATLDCKARFGDLPGITVRQPNPS